MMAPFFASLPTRAVLISDSHNLQSTHFSLFSLSLYLVFSRRRISLLCGVKLNSARPQNVHARFVFERPKEQTKSGECGVNAKLVVLLFSAMLAITRLGSNF
jgi:hypothetical protein